MVHDTRRFAPRAAYAARYACPGRENSVKRTERSSMLDWKCKLATWKCQEPRRHAQGKQPTDTTCTHEYTTYVCTWYLVFAMYILRSIYIYVRLEACDYTKPSLSLGWRIGTDTDCGCAGLCSAYLMSMVDGGENTATSGWSDSDGCLWSRQPHRYPH